MLEFVGQQVFDGEILMVTRAGGGDVRAIDPPLNGRQPVRIRHFIVGRDLPLRLEATDGSYTAMTMCTVP